MEWWADESSPIANQSKVINQFCSFVVVFLFSLSFHFVQTKKMNISSIFRFVWNYTTLRMLSHQKQICDIILLFIVGSFICLVGYSLDFFQFVNDLFLYASCFVFLQSCIHVYIYEFTLLNFFLVCLFFYIKWGFSQNIFFLKPPFCFYNT